MVVYDSLCADLSAEFLDFIPGTIEEKLLTLQEQLGEHFPDIILQYLCGEEQNIVQIKGSWGDVKNIHEVLEAWMNSGKGTDVEKVANDMHSIPEKIEGIEDGIFFDESKNQEYTNSVDPTILRTSNNTISTVEKNATQERPLQENGDESKLPMDISTQSQDEKTTDNTKEADEIKSLTSSNDVKPTKSNVVTRSGRVVKRTAALLEGDAIAEIFDGDNEISISVINPSIDKSMLENSHNGENVNEHSEHGSQDSDFQNDSCEENDAVVKNDKRGRKRKSLVMIKHDEVDAAFDKCVDSAPDDTAFKCPLCDYVTTGKRHLKAHLFRCHVEAEHQCKFCPKKYGLAKDLRAHLKTHFPKLKCQICLRKFPTRSLLDLHVQRYHSISRESKRLKKFEQPSINLCPHCEYTTHTEKNLSDHIARHHMEKSFTCEHCSKSFGLKKDLITHSKLHSDTFCCEECGKSLGSKNALKNHVAVIHRGEKNTYSKPYVCDNCGEICRNKTHYKEHMNKEHLHQKPFGCPLCPMSFYTNAALKAHLKTHSDVRKFKCDKCGKGFKAANSLRVHQITHLEYGQRPHVCTTCNKSFSQKGALIRHQRIHSGEKPYKCRLCESAFTDYSILRRHMLGVHKINSRNLCQRNDTVGNRGGPKPDRVKVGDINKFKHIIRKPEEQDQSELSIGKVLTDSGISLLNKHSNEGEDLKLEDNLQFQMGNDNKFTFTPMDSSTMESVRYIIQEADNVQTESIRNDLLVGGAALTPQNISVANSENYTVTTILPTEGVTVSDVGQTPQIVSGLGYTTMPFTVQQIAANDGQNISIQILQAPE